MPIAIFSKRLGGAFSSDGRPDFFGLFSDFFGSQLRSVSAHGVREREKFREMSVRLGREDATPSRACPSPRDARTEDSRVRSAWRNMRAAVAPRAIPGTRAPARRAASVVTGSRLPRRRRRARLVVSRGARVRVDVVSAWRARRTARVPRRSRVAESRRARGARPWSRPRYPRTRSGPA